MVLYNSRIIKSQRFTIGAKKNQSGKVDSIKKPVFCVAEKQAFDGRIMKTVQLFYIDERLLEKLSRSFSRSA